jgi:hypothetical protein
MSGAKAARRSFAAERGNPRYVWGEPLDSALEHLLDVVDDLRRHMHGDDGALRVVDAETGGAVKLAKKMTKPLRRPNLSSEDYQRVVSVLKHRARGPVDERVLEHVVAADQTLEDVRRDEEEVRREGVALPQPMHAADPLPWDAIEEDGRARGSENVIHPITPKNGEAAGEHDSSKTGPANRIEGLGEVQLENDTWSAVAVARLNELGGVDEIFRDVPAGEEASLVNISDGADPTLQPGGEGLANAFDGAVLQGNRPERGRGKDAGELGEEGNVRHVDAEEISSAGVELFKKTKEGRPDAVASRTVEAGPKPIRARSARAVERVDGHRHFLGRERLNKARTIDTGAVDVELVDVEVPRVRRPPPEEIVVEGEKGGGLGLVHGNGHAVHLDRANGDAAEALGGSGVEETGVFVPFFDRPKFAPLLPVRGTLKHQALERRPAQHTQPELVHRERARLLKQIKHINKEGVVFFKLRIEAVQASPNLGGRAEGLEASRDVSCRIDLSSRSRPGREGGRKKEGIQEPGILETKTRSSRDGGGGGDKEGNMVRSRVRKGGEGGVGEG